MKCELPVNISDASFFSSRLLWPEFKRAAEVPAVTALSTAVFQRRTEAFSLFRLTLRLFPAKIHFSTKPYFSWSHQWHEICLRTAQCSADPPEGKQDVIWAKPLRESRRGESEKCYFSQSIRRSTHTELAHLLFSGVSHWMSSGSWSRISGKGTFMFVFYRGRNMFHRMKDRSSFPGF